MSPPSRASSNQGHSSSGNGEGNEHARVLIVDDDDRVRETLGEMLKAFGIHVRTFQNPLDALAHVKNAFYNVMLLDISMPQLSGLELLPKMRLLSPASKFIMVTGCASKENAVQALKYGAFDFLEKPVSIELLFHAVERALRVQQTEMRLVETLVQLEKSNDRITEYKSHEKHMEKWLAETNRALSILAQNLENTRLESEKQMADATRKLILPIVAKLCQDEIVFSRYPHELRLLTQFIDDMTHNLASEQKLTVLLSQTELQVASLIKLGMSTQEIAEHMNLSPYTVKTHRRNIRKKLKIRNGKFNLKTYLSRESTGQRPAPTFKN